MGFEKLTASKYQLNIYNWVESETGNGIVNAVAGAGKTTTLVEVAKMLNQKNSIFIAFNKHIVNTLTKKLPDGFNCKTIHSIGFNCLIKYLGGNLELKEYKYGNLANETIQKLTTALAADYEVLHQKWVLSWNTTNDLPEPKRPPSFEEIKGQFMKLIDLSRCTLTNLSDNKDVQDMVEHYGIDEHIPLNDILPYVNAILEEGISLAKSHRQIDYTDMVFLPSYWELTPSKCDWILVDEAQDLNAAQLSLLLKMRKPSTRMLFVGDPRQAIYGFAGADTEAYNNIKVATTAKELELSICYRCPKKVVALAKEIVSNISSSDNAREGEIVHITEEQLVKSVKEGDLVLCRSTEPLIRNCITLISNKVSATVRGRDIGKSLTSIIQDISKISGFTFKNFTYYLNLYSTERISKLEKKQNNERKIIEFKDQILSIETCYQRFYATSLYELCREIESLFSDDRSKVTLSTIHRAKGLEENRVFILNFDKLPLTWVGQLDWQLVQEQNLKYVGITRAKEVLYLVKETIAPNELSSIMKFPLIIEDFMDF